MTVRPLFFLAQFLIGIFFIPQLVYSQTNCDLKKDDDNIKVYLCDSKIGNFKTIVVELDVPATLSQYAAVVLDVSAYEEWQYKTSSTNIVKTISRTEFYYYSEINTPWPTSNRDYVFHFLLKQNKETKVLTVSLTEMPDFVPRKSGVVRLPEAHSILTVTPIDTSNVRVRYVIDVDPGGDIPAWIANMFAAMAPWHSYNNFRKIIISQEDERITIPFIEDY